MPIKIRQKTCKNPSCKAKFVPKRPLQQVCSMECAIAYSKQVREKQERAETKVKKLKLKTRSQWFDECKLIAQKYARVRDANDGCISCDKPSNWWGQWHGSHFRPAGNFKAIALNLWNIHKACSECNNHKSGNLVDYQDRLISKIGQKKVDWLKSQNQAHTHSIEYLIRYKKVIGKRLKRMEVRNEARIKNNGNI